MSIDTIRKDREFVYEIFKSLPTIKHSIITDTFYMAFHKFAVSIENLSGYSDKTYDFNERKIVKVPSSEEVKKANGDTLQIRRFYRDYIVNSLIPETVKEITENDEDSKRIENFFLHKFGVEAGQSLENFVDNGSKDYFKNLKANESLPNRYKMEIAGLTKFFDKKLLQDKFLSEEEKATKLFEKTHGKKEVEIEKKTEKVDFKPSSKPTEPIIDTPSERTLANEGIRKMLLAKRQEMIKKAEEEKKQKLENPQKPTLPPKPATYTTIASAPATNNPEVGLCEKIGNGIKSFFSGISNMFSNAWNWFTSFFRSTP